MKDIVEQLREWAELKRAIDHDEVGRFKLEDAVAEIERLRAERDALRGRVAELESERDSLFDLCGELRRAAGLDPEAAP
jgi:uncharacterized coiled-coil DUF342 family protein